ILQRCYGPLCCAMGRYTVLWTVIPFYVPLYRSMDRYAGLWAVIRFYGPSHRSMSRRAILWTHLHYTILYNKIFLIIPYIHSKRICFYCIIFMPVIEEHFYLFKQIRTTK